MGVRTEALTNRLPVAENTTRPPRVRRGFFVTVALVGFAIIAAACGSSGAASPGATKPSGTTSHDTGTVLVSSARIGALGTVLVDQSGFTLYRFTLDSRDRSDCTGACAAAWPPLLVPAGGHLEAGSGVGATLLATIERPGGARQVVFNGTPLYRYAGDKKAGQTTGQGVAGTWFVVSASASPLAAAPSTSTTTAPMSGATPSGAAAGTSGSGGAQPAVSPSVAPPATSATTIAPPSTSPPATSPPSTSPPMTSPPTTMPSGGGGYGY